MSNCNSDVILCDRLVYTFHSRALDTLSNTRPKVNFIKKKK